MSEKDKSLNFFDKKKSGCHNSANVRNGHGIILRMTSGLGV
jgi:hypothetical protein